MHGTLALLDDNGIEGELVVREARSGRAEVVQMWGRPESVRQEFRRRRDFYAWPASRCSAPTCCSARSFRAPCAPPVTRSVQPGEEAELLVVDLTVDPEDRIERSAGAGMPRLGFYSHVEQDVRRRAEEAGFERVVPRSRMAREGPALVEAMLAGGA